MEEKIDFSEKAYQIGRKMLNLENTVIISKENKLILSD